MGDPGAPALPHPEDEDYDFDDEDEDKDEDGDGGVPDDVFETVFDVLDPDDDKMKSLLETAAQKEKEENDNMGAKSGEFKRQRTE